MTIDWKNTFFEKSERAFVGKQITRYINGDGYSMVDKYNEIDKFQLGIKKQKNVRVFTKVYFDTSEFEENDEYASIKVSMSMTTELIENNIKKYMLNNSSIRGLKPVDLFSNKDFFVYKKDGKIYQLKNKKYHLTDFNRFYTKLYKAHVASIFTLRGLSTRLRILARKITPLLIGKLLVVTSSSLHWWLKGSYYKYDVIMASLRERYQDERQFKETNKDRKTVNFFNYDVEIWTIFTYSIVIILIYTFFRDLPIFNLSENNSLSTIYTIAIATVSISAYDYFVPRILKKVIKSTEIYIHNLSYKGVKVNM